jgi:hypothetical protein
VESTSYEAPHAIFSNLTLLLSLSGSNILLSILFSNILSTDFHFWFYTFILKVHGGENTGWF